MKAKINTPHYIRAAVKPGSINVSERTVEVVFATETPCVMWDWDIGYFNEILECTPEAGDLSRLNNGAPLCNTHQTYDVNDVIGVVSNARFGNRQGIATIRFSKRADVEPIWQDVQDGILSNISIGYNPLEYTIVEQPKSNETPTYRATKWEAMELSLVPVPADPDAKVRAMQNKNNYSEINIIENSKKRNMETTQTATAQTVQAVTNNNQPVANVPTEPVAEPVQNTEPATDANEVRKEATIAERKRANEILKAVRMVKLPNEFAEELIGSDRTLDQCRAAIIDKLAEANPVTTRSVQMPNVTADEAPKRMDAMQRALEFRTNPRAFKAGEVSEYRSYSLLDMARAFLEASGENTRSMSNETVARTALGLRGTRAGGMYSTGDFPALLANVFNKKLLDQYQLQPPTFQAWTRQSTANDFKAMMRNRLGDLFFEPVQEGGEYKAAALSETAESYQVAKYGRIVLIDWEAIVNDDLSAFTRIPSMLASAAVQQQADIIYSILLNNPNMSDNNAIFSAAHKNITATGTAIGIDSLGVGRAMMRKQKTLANQPMNIKPKFLLVAPDQEQLAFQYTSQNYVPVVLGNQTGVNPYAGILTPITEARLDGNKAWYLIADPATIDTVEYAFLDGEELHTENRVAFEKDGFEIKARMVFGAKAIDWRGMYKNAGA